MSRSGPQEKSPVPEPQRQFGFRLQDTVKPLEKRNEESSETPVSPPSSVPNQDSDHARPASGTRSAADMISEFLEEAALEMKSRLVLIRDVDLETLREDSETAAVSILSIIFEETIFPLESVSPSTAFDTTACLHKLKQQIQSFLTLYFTKAHFKYMVTRIYKSASENLVEAMVEEGYRFLEELVQLPADMKEEDCFYTTLSILKERLIYTRHKLFSIMSRGVGVASPLKIYTTMMALSSCLDAYMKHLEKWLTEQGKLQPNDNPVEKVLCDIRPALSNLENLSPFVTRSSTSQWKTEHLKVLTYEVAKRILKSKHILTLEPLRSDLLRLLEPKMSYFKVPPEDNHIESVAKMACEELCTSKVSLKSAATVDRNYSTEIAKVVHRYLMKPQKAPGFLKRMYKSVHGAIKNCFGTQMTLQSTGGEGENWKILL